MILAHRRAQYQVGKFVGGTEKYRLYICDEVSTQQQSLLQIATATEYNGELDRAIFILKELWQAARLLDWSAGEDLNYDRLFPGVVDSFISPEEQGRRRVNILIFRKINSITKLVPLSNLREKDRLRVDLETSAWIMGRLLKLIAFAHGKSITVGLLTGNNVLIEPERHSAVVFDWSSAIMHRLVAPHEQCKDDIAAAAQAVFAAIGGNPKTLEYPYATQEHHSYIEFLRRLANREEGIATRVHTNFYGLVYGLFGRSFRPFNTLPL